MASVKEEVRPKQIIARTGSYEWALTGLNTIIVYNERLPKQGSLEWLTRVRAYWQAINPTTMEFTGEKFSACGGSEIDKIRRENGYGSGIYVTGHQIPNDYRSFIMGKKFGAFSQNLNTCFGNLVENPAEAVLFASGELIELTSIQYNGPNNVPIKYSPDGMWITNGQILSAMCDNVELHDVLNAWVGKKLVSFSSQCIRKDLEEIYGPLSQMAFAIILLEHKNRFDKKFYGREVEAGYQCQVLTGLDLPMVIDSGCDAVIHTRNNHVWTTFEQFDFTNRHTPIAKCEFEFNIPYACIVLVFIHKDGLIQKAKQRTEDDAKLGILSPEWYDFSDELKNSAEPIDFISESQKTDDPYGYIEKLITATKNGAYEVRHINVNFNQVLDKVKVDEIRKFGEELERINLRNFGRSEKNREDTFELEQKIQDSVSQMIAESVLAQNKSKTFVRHLQKLGHQVVGTVHLKLVRPYIRALSRQPGYIDEMADLIKESCKAVDSINKLNLGKEAAWEWIQNNCVDLEKLAEKFGPDKMKGRTSPKATTNTVDMSDLPKSVRDRSEKKDC